MTAVRIEVPDGVASPVWLAHVVRNAVQRALADELPDGRSLRVEAEDESYAEPLSVGKRGNHPKGRDANSARLSTEVAF